MKELGERKCGMRRDGDRFGLLEDPRVRKLDGLPEGWHVMGETFTQPNGWVWANNGETVASGRRERALVREGAA